MISVVGDIYAVKFAVVAGFVSLFSIMACLVLSISFEMLIWPKNMFG